MPSATKKNIDVIIHNLTKHGRAISAGNDSRYLSKRFRNWTKDNKVIFATNSRFKKSVIVIKPGYKMKKYKNGRVGIFFEDY